MKILEVKNSLVKISYDVTDNLYLSGFVIIEDTNTPYVSQVVNLKSDNGINYAVLKLLFTFNSEGILKQYDGTIPSTNASLTRLPASELLNVLPSEDAVYLGVVQDDNTPFKLALSSLNSNLLICSDNIESTGELLNNFIPQIGQSDKKAVLIDVNGDFSSVDSFVFTKDFKLPLNAEFLDFIFEHDLEGVEPVSRAVVQDIFNEVKDYLTTLPQGYLPIDLFINVVQQQYQETNIAELVLLKNRLLKYQEENVFASGNDNVLILRDKIAHSDSLVVDVSCSDDEIKKKLINFVYDCIATVNADSLVFITIDNEIADKKLLRKTLEYRNVCSTIICSHSFKYLPDLKQIIQNLILFTPQTLQHDFLPYNTFLSKLDNNEFVIYGPATQNIPFIVKLENWEDIVNAPTPEELPNEQKSDANTDKNLSNNRPQNTVENENADDEIPDTTVDELAEKQQEEEVYPQSENAEEFINNEDVTKEPLNQNTQIVEEDNNSNNVLNENDNIEIIDAISEDLFEANEEETFENEALNDREELEDEVAKDIEASLYKKIEDETIDSENDVNPEIFNDISEDELSLSDDDLDYIESMPVDENNQEEYSSVDFADFEEPREESEILTDDAISDFSETSPVTDDETKINDNIPVYTPPEFDTGVVDTEVTFDPGDIVSHPKYGQGVVEKMINYGSKTLCSISFVNIGRRLLDPKVSELTLFEHAGAKSI